MLKKLLFFKLLFCIYFNTYSQDGSLDLSFNSLDEISSVIAGGSSPDGLINTIGIQSNGKTVIAGIFSSINNTTINGIARVNNDGSLDTTFITGTGINIGATIAKIIIQPDDKILVIGKFSSYNNIPTNSIIRLNSDGTIDNTFNIGTGFNPSSQILTCLKLLPNNKILVAGNFNTYNGITVNDIVMLNTNGSIDNTFNASGIQTTSSLSIQSIDIQSDNKIIIYTKYRSNSGGNITENTYLKRLNSNGSVDNTFIVNNNIFHTATISSPFPLIGYITKNIYEIKALASGKIIIGGDFTNVYGNSYKGLARLNSNGGIDTSFTIGSGIDGPCPNCAYEKSIYSIDIQQDNKIIIGGKFSTFNGVSKNGILRLNANGSLDNTFNSGTGITNTTTANKVKSIKVLSNTKVIIAGFFDSYNGIIRKSIARLNGSLPPINTINDSGTALNGVASIPISNVLSNDTYNSLPATFTNVVLSFVSSTNTGITLNITTGSVNISSSVPVGVYTLTYSICDINNSSNCATATASITVNPSIINAIDDDFSSISINNATGGLTTSVTSNDLLNGVTVNNSDIIISLVNNGGLTGASINNAGILSVPSGFPSDIYTLTYNICQNTNPSNCDTAIIYIAITDPFVQTPNIVFGTRANNTVNLVEIQNDSKILIGGTFDQYSFINSYKIARLNSDLTLDTSFLSSGPIPIDKNARDMKIQADGKVILVGSFDSFNGGTNGRGIVRLNTNGTVDTNFNVGGTGIPSGTNQSINACAIQSDGKILLGGGYIDSFNGINTRNLIRLNTNGTLDTSFNYPYILNRSIISRIAIQSDGKILVGGVYKVGTTTDPGQPSVFRLNTNGSLDTTFTTAATGVNVFATNCSSCLSAIQNIIPLQTGKILIVGVFNTYNGNPYKNIVRLNSDGSIDTTFNPNLSTNRVIKDVAIEPSGKMIIGGEFSTFNGATVDKIIRLNTNGTLDNTFSSGTGLYDDQSNGSNIYNNIQVLKRQGDGKIIVAGRFSAYNFIGANCITRIAPSIPGGQARSSFQYYEPEKQVVEANNSDEIILFPNPSKGDFYISLGDYENYISVEIYSIFGKKIMNFTNINQPIIYISDLKSGTYILKINQEEKVTTKKLIVN